MLAGWEVLRGVTTRRFSGRERIGRGLAMQGFTCSHNRMRAFNTNIQHATRFTVLRSTRRSTNLFSSLYSAANTTGSRIAGLALGEPTLLLHTRSVEEYLLQSPSLPTRVERHAQLAASLRAYLRGSYGSISALP